MARSERASRPQESSGLSTASSSRNRIPQRSSRTRTRSRLRSSAASGSPAAAGVATLQRPLHGFAPLQRRNAARRPRGAEPASAPAGGERKSASTPCRNARIESQTTRPLQAISQSSSATAPTDAPTFAASSPSSSPFALRERASSTASRRAAPDSTPGPAPAPAGGRKRSRSARKAKAVRSRPAPSQTSSLSTKSASSQSVR